MSIEVRRVQRLGSSSLVVTIPKEWASRLGIQAGSKVYLIDEGDSIRISSTLVSMKNSTHIKIDLSRFDAKTASNAVNCIYLAGLSEATVKVSGDLEEVLYLMRMKSDSLTGVDVSANPEGVVKIKILLDIERVDVSNLILSLGFNATRFLKLLTRVTSKGSVEPSDLQEASFLWREYTRIQHTIIRYIVAKKLRESTMIDIQHTSLAASYLGFVNDTLWNTIRLLDKMKITGLPEDFEKLAGEIGSLITLVTRLVISPSSKRLREAFETVSMLQKRVESMLVSSKEPGLIFLLTRLHDILRILNIVMYIAACKNILSNIQVESQETPQ